MRKAFSLVELSVVLIILGLLIAGVVTGKKMINNAKLMKTLAVIEEYNASISMFYASYDALPGDMNNAYSYFTSDCAGGDQDECNGDGDLRIEFATNNTNEIAKIFHHINISGIWAKNWVGNHSYTPNSAVDAAGNTCSSSNYGVVPGATSPTFGDTTIAITAAYIAESVNNNLFIIGGSKCNDYPVYQGFTPLVASQIDIKYDDGVANTGNVLGYTASGAPTCHSSGVYQLSGTQKACYLRWIEQIPN